MFVPHDEFLRAYNKIKEDARECHPAPSILIFVAAQPDALCACRLLTIRTPKSLVQKLLQGDLVPHEVKPVVGYDDINVEMEQASSRPYLRSVIMLNCGGNLPVLEYFGEREDITFYIADTFRPLHLANVYADDRVLLFVDRETEESAAIPSYEDYQKFLEGDSESEYEDVSDREGSQDGDMSPRKRRRVAREAREARRERLAAYYNSGSYYGISSAAVLYEWLATKYNKADNDLLWLAIVGLTDQYLADMIDRDRYLATVQYLREEVLRFNPADDEEGSAQEPRGGLIRFDEEFRFVLMRHWTLYDSMLNSTYVATNLSTWTEKGRESLETLIARMGFSLRDTQERYTVMSTRVRENLRAKLEERGGMFGLTDLLYPSFHRRRLSRTPFSASDMVYCLIGLLERAPTSVATTADPAGEEQGETQGFDYRKHWRDNVTNALEAFSDQPEILAEGVRLAMEQQVAVMTQVRSIMEQKKCQKTSLFRLARTVSDPLIFSSPLILERLGLFLYTYYSNDARGSRALPVVVATDLENSSTTLVVGVSGTSKYGRVQKNTFGAVFQQAAERVDARFQHDSFNTNLIEIDSAAFKEFSQALNILYRQA